MEIQIGVSKINKYASSESGDTLEVVERPNGGVSVVLADGQRSGKGAKRISNMVVRKVVALLAEGVRDGPAARAASDYLYSMRGGHVQATLNIISIDLETNTIVVTRNNPAPLLVYKNATIISLDQESQAVGIYRTTRPVIHQFPLEPGLILIAFTDGVLTAGEKKGLQLDIPQLLNEFLLTQPSAQEISDYLMDQALILDDHRPTDDISLVVVSVKTNESDSVRRMSVRLPL